MRNPLRALLTWLAALALLLPAAPAIADQSSWCLPTSGVVSGLAIVTGVNSAVQAVGSMNAGSSPPTNPCSAAPVVGQSWLDTSGALPVQKVTPDGTTWFTQGVFDTGSSTWEPPIGGGAGSIASASTTDLWSIAPSLVTITGTTPISKLAGSSDAAIGTHKTLVFAGALTLTYSATQLITPTAASINTRAGDTATVVALGGGNVRITGFLRADGSPLYNPAYGGDTGSGGTAGILPPPPAGSAALNKVASADGGFNGTGVPVGASFPYAGIAAPGGYVFEFGQALARSGTYAGLWAVLHVSATVTVSIASPAVVSWTGHPLAIGSPVSLATTGTLPIGLGAATTYYVISAGYGANSFELSATVGGSAINTSGSQSGVHTATYAPYGGGDFSTTFNLPDMRGRVVAGTDTMGGTAASRLTNPGSTVGGVDGSTLGASGGQQAHTLTTTEIPPLTFSITAPTYHGQFGSGGSLGWSSASVQDFAAETINTNSVGGGGASNVVQPTLIQNYIIRY